MTTPTSRRNLDIAIERLVGRGTESVRVRRLLANAIVGQLLPDGAVKGGAALKLRFGMRVTRYSRDLDTVRMLDIEAYARQLEANLLQGWHGFTGRLIKKQKATPKHVPHAYVMQPFEIKLSYKEKSRITIPLEVGYNEIGDAENPDYYIPAEPSNLLEQLGFPPLRPIPFMKLEYQIAQKLHGLTEVNSQRIHDLVDLQIIVQENKVDWLKVKAICLRLFAYRAEQDWPPIITPRSDWNERYVALAQDLNILNFDEAIEWATCLIRKIDKA